VEQEADQAKGSWQGATFDDMVMRWGPPNRSATLSDGVGVGIPFGTTVNPPICERTVTFQENKVVDQNWTGDPGYCRYFKRA
jgi:hypothetical protein